MTSLKNFHVLVALTRDGELLALSASKDAGELRQQMEKLDPAEVAQAGIVKNIAGCHVKTSFPLPAEAPAEDEDDKDPPQP